MVRRLCLDCTSYDSKARFFSRSIMKNWCQLISLVAKQFTVGMRLHFQGWAWFVTRNKKSSEVFPDVGLHAVWGPSKFCICCFNQRTAFCETWALIRLWSGWRACKRAIYEDWLHKTQSATLNISETSTEPQRRSAKMLRAEEGRKARKKLSRGIFFLSSWIYDHHYLLWFNFHCKMIGIPPRVMCTVRERFFCIPRNWKSDARELKNSKINESIAWKFHLGAKNFSLPSEVFFFEVPNAIRLHTTREWAQN